MEGWPSSFLQGLFVWIILDRLLGAALGIKILLLSHVKATPLLTELQLQVMDYFFSFMFV